MATTRSRAAGSVRASAAPVKVTIPAPASPSMSAAGLRPVEAKSSVPPRRPENPGRSTATESTLSDPVSVAVSPSRRSVAWPEAAPPAICIFSPSRSSRPLSKRSVVANRCAERASVRSSVPTLRLIAVEGGRSGAGANFASDQRVPDLPGCGGPSASAKMPPIGRRSTVSSPSISADGDNGDRAAPDLEPSASSALEIAALACAAGALRRHGLIGQFAAGLDPANRRRELRERPPIAAQGRIEPSICRSERAAIGRRKTERGGQRGEVRRLDLGGTKQLRVVAPRRRQEASAPRKL